MAEIVQDENPRRNLYRLLLADKTPGVGDRVKKYSFTEFENRLLTDEDTQNKMGWYLESKGIVADPVDFSERYLKTTSAPPAPKPQAAPIAPPPVEQEAYVPEPKPLVGSDSYNNEVRELNPFPTPGLGETFGGAPAVFETREQRRQEEMSPVFKAHNLAFVDNPFSPNPYNAPVAEEQRRAQKQFAKATKQQQQAALRGGTGFELQQERANEARESTQKLKDFGSYIGATFDNMIDKAKGAERIFAAKQKALLTFGDRRKKAEEEEKRVKQQIVNYVDKLDADFAAKQTDYNIEGNLFDAIRKGQWDRIPEAFAYNLAQIGVQALAATSTGGYSMFAQVFPDMYKAGVEEIAKKTKTTPEQVIASGNDKELLSYIGGGINGYIEYLSGGILGKAMRSEGAYKFLRDKALEKIGKTKWKQAAASAAALGGVSGIEGLTEVGQGLTEVITPQIAAADTFKGARENIYRELQKPETQRRLASEFVGGAAGGGGIAAGGRALSRTLEGDFTYGDVRKAPQRADYDVVQTDNKIQERNKIAQAMEEAVKANPEAEGQIRQQYQKRINEAAPTDEEVLSAYDGLAVLPETEEKNTIRENLEAYMAEKGIQPEPTGMEAGLGEGLRVTSPVIQTVNADFPPPQPPTSEEEVAIEEAPAEEELSLEDQLMGLVPQEETAPAPAEEVAPAEEEVATEEIAEEPTPLKDGDFVIVNGEKGVVTISPGGQISVETDTKIYDLDERGLAGIGGKLVTPKEQTQTEYEVEVLDDDNAIVNGEPFKIIRDAKGNTIALQGETRTIRTEPVMVDVDIKRNKAQVTETLQEQAEEVESLSPDMTLDKQKFVDDIIGQNMTEGVDRILSEGVTEKTAEKDLLQFKLFVEATIADLRARQKGNPYADAMIEQLQEALNTVYYEYYSQGRKAETRAAKTQKKTDRGTKGKERVSPKPAEGKQPTTPVTPPAAAPKKEAAPKPEPKKEAPKPEPKKETPKEEKPVSGTPQEGDKVEIAPQREGGSPRNMVFKDGEWKQNVGGDIVKVGPAVQQQAQEAFGGKAEVKPAETKEGKKAEAKEEKVGIKEKTTTFAADEKSRIQSERTGDRGGRYSSRGLAPLEGAPAKQGFHGPDPRLVEVAEKYARENGIPLVRQSEYVEVDVERAKRIAQAYEEMKHNPQNPAVKEAYQNLIKQTIAQYKALQDAGYKFYFIDLNTPEGQEYASTPWNALRDLRENKRMGVFSTEEGFGSNEDFNPEANPLLEETEFKWPLGEKGPLRRVLANDLFRAVHDAFGHGLEGAGFRARGEENAWQAHIRLFTGSAQGAITTETRGQNSWLNFGPFGEKNRTAKVEYTEFADQKTGLMPEWTWTEGRAGDMLSAPSFTSQQSSEAATAFDKAKTSKGFDKKYGKGAYKALSDITKNFDEIMDKVSDKIKQDCL